MSNLHNQQMMTISGEPTVWFHWCWWAAVVMLVVTLPLGAGAATAGPTLAVRDIVMPAGRTFTQPLDGMDPQGLPLNFSVVSISDPNVTGTLTNCNRSLRLTVSGMDGTGTGFTGDLILELFENLVPKTSTRIIQLVNSGFYDGLTFHRVIQTFMAQGGDPLGTGLGGSGQVLDDELVSALSFTGFGQLSMANAGHDTSDSQFFITNPSLVLGDATLKPPQWLDFGYTIFGQLTHGFDVLTKVLSTPVDANNLPVTPVVINRATVFTNTQAAVLHLQAAAGFTGTVAVVVQAADPNGIATQQTFQVTVVPNTVNDPPFFGPVPLNVNTVANTPVWFTLNATDVNGYSISNLYVNGYLLLVDPATGVFPATLSGWAYDFTTGRLGVQAVPQFIGRVDLFLALSDPLFGFSTAGGYDTQHYSLTVLGSGCGYVLYQTNIAATADGITGTVGVVAGPNCVWAGSANQHWITILSGTNGMGSGGVSYAIAANPTVAPRTGQLLIAGQSLTVSQAGRIVPPVIITDGVLPVAEVGSPYQITLAGFGGTAPVTWSAIGLPAGLTLVSSTGAITGTPTTVTVTNFTIQVTDANGLFSMAPFSLQINGVPLPPVITITPAVSNAFLQANNWAVLIAGETNVFTVGAADPGNLPMLYQWTFDDGVTNPWTTTSVGTHAYPTNHCGPHIASVTVSNGSSATTTNLGVTVACSLKITKLQTLVNFGKTNADTCALTANLLLGTNYNLSNKVVTLDVGGARVSFPLDAKGKGRGVGPHGSCSLTYNKPSGSYLLTASLAKGFWRTPWGTNGMINATVPKSPPTVVTLLVTVIVDNEAFAGTRALLYTATHNKTGAAK